MRTSTIIVASAAALAGFILATDAQAQTHVPGEFRVYEENDFFNPFTEQTDRYYTQGLRFERLRPSSKSDAHFLPGIRHADWCRLFCGNGSDEDALRLNVNTGYAIGQNMYTPAEITIADPQPDDRPWAGMLYASRIARITYKERSLHAQRQDRIEVSLGIVGPASLAEETQIAWHKLIGAPRPEGWDNQLKNEPVVQLRYEAALRWPETDGGNVDIISRTRGNLGNALTSLESEVTGRIGWNLSGFSVSTIPLAPPPPGFAMVGQTSSLIDAGRRTSGNLFVRVGAKAVAHNITLDGNSIASNDIRINRKPFVTEFAAGFELSLVGHVSLTAQFVRRGSEFETRRGRDAPAQHFGAISLAFPLGR